MLLQKVSPFQKRKKLRELLNSANRALPFPGAISGLTAMQIEAMGFEGVYISGSVLSNDLGYPDLGLTTLTEVAWRGRQIARATQLPAIIDADTGFGEVLHVARTIQELIEMGLAGCHLEDQVLPKRCGHLDGKSLIKPEDMARKIKIASEMKQDLDPHFLLIARTDARATEGLTGAIKRAEAYLKAGADMIFPEALTSLEEFYEFKKQTGAMILANMTEFGKSPLWSLTELTQAGANIVIYPVSLLRVSMKATEMLLADIKNKGHQRDQIPHMQTRTELYDLTAYSAYNQWDQNIFNFTTNPNQKE